NVGVIGLDTSAILMTSNGGVTWNTIAVPINSGWTSFSISGAFFLDANTLFLIWGRTGGVGFGDGGLYRTTIFYKEEGGSVSTSQPLNSLNATIVPNPNDGNATISFALDQDEQIEFRLFDLSGRDCGALFAGTLPAGDHHIKINC